MALSVDQALLKARTLAAKGDRASAETLYRTVLASQPKNRLALQGLQTLAERGPQEAAADTAPLLALYNLGQIEPALTLADQLIRQHPRDANLRNIAGVLNARLRRFEAAAEHYRAAINSAPLFADAHSNLGAALKDLGRLDEAQASYLQAVALKPDLPEAHFNLGAVSKDLGNLDEAIARFEAAVALKPDFASAWNSLGGALEDAGRADDAFASYGRALTLRPDYAEAHSNLGNSLKNAGRLEEAVAHYRQAAALKPDFPEAHNNLGVALKALGWIEEAATSFRQAAALAPDFAEAHANLGNALRDLGRLDEAVAAYDAALAVRPSYDNALAARLNQQAHMCDWDPIDAARDTIPHLGLEQMVPPFAMLPQEDAPGRHLQRAKVWAKTQYGAVDTPPVSAPPTARPERLRIGYFSADFHTHATMHLMAGLLEAHDRGRFEIHAYSYGPDTEDEMSARAAAAVDHFHKVQHLSERETAQKARSHGIDIAVDLKGYTLQSRTGIFAHRPAPLSMNYLGYPGSLGADFIDYVVGDSVVIPQGAEADYSEMVIRLPGSYQVNDDSRAIADEAFTRADLGLPQDGVVFCCFNANYKIGRPEFDIWLRLLQAVDGSVLWLLRSNPWAEANMRKEAQARGVDPARLVFADKLPHARHLARHRCADLFLDTFHYNAHTTASDALWAGLPVISKRGLGFPARVGASLLSVVGLNELIVDTDEDYERLALSLATDTAALARAKAKLEMNRLTMPLFDTERFARHLENAYDQAFALYVAGQAPDHITI